MNKSFNHVKSEDYSSNFSVFSFKDAIPTGYHKSYLKQLLSGDTRLLFSLLINLEFLDIINLRLTCKSIFKKIDKKMIKLYIREGGITEKCRKKFWMNNIDYKSMENLIRKEIEINDNSQTNNIQITSNITLYQRILKKSEYEKIKEDKKFLNTCEEISRDLNRTFHIGKLSTIEGQQELGRVLQCLAFIRPEIGYCQGMNFVAGALLHFMDDEELVFWIFLSLLDELELNSLYFKNMPDYSIRVFQLNHLVKNAMPDLFYHFKKQQINPDIFFSKWILTIFSSYLPFDTLAKVWDIFLIDKWKAIFKFSLVFLNELHPYLINMDLHDVSIFFREKSKQLHLDVRAVCKNYSSHKITNKHLRELRENFFLDQVKKKLEDPQSNWENDQTEALVIYKLELQRFERLTKKDISFLQMKLEEFNKEYQTIKASYLNQMKFCGLLKNRIEELCESKIAYEKVINILIQENAEKNYQSMNQYLNSSRNNGSTVVNITTPLSQKNKSISHSTTTTKNKSTKKSKSLKNKFSPLKTFENNKEIQKIAVKLKQVNKELEEVNKSMLENYKILDEKKYFLENLKIKKTKYKQSLQRCVQEYDRRQTEMIKNLSDKLKLSEKFVKTSQF